MYRELGIRQRVPGAPRRLDDDPDERVARRIAEQDQSPDTIFVGLSPSWGMVDSVGVWRRYEIVSLHGTNGTYLQRLLVFTTARRKAPAGVIDCLLRRFPAGLRPPARSAAAPDGSPSNSAGNSAGSRSGR
jgi:hypothetical protein